MRPGRPLWLGMISVALLFPACLPVREDSDPPIGPGDPDFERVAQIRFLGVGGFSIRLGEDVILTAPLYSNPTVPEVLGPRMLPNEERIHRFHPVEKDTAAILVGHAHYDHLMDVPVLLQELPHATVYGSSTTRRVLAGYQPREDGPAERWPVPSSRVVALDEQADTRQCGVPAWENDPSQCGLSPGRPGEWVHVLGTRVRIRALCSAHPAQVLGGIHLWPGCLTAPRVDPPQEARDYPEGPTFAFLVDFLGPTDTDIRLRVYYQDAPSTGPLGLVPAVLVAERPVDVLLLCAGNFESVEQPERIVSNTGARTIILGHWEDFFRSQEHSPTPIPGLDVGRYMKALRDEAGSGVEIILPRPQVQVNVSL